MTDLLIGKAGSRRFKLPADVQTQTIAVLGIRGSGKSHTAAVIAEELLEVGRQVVVIDPTDAWWGLKSSRDGKKGGYPIIVLGGAHGDLPLSENDGALVADFLVEQVASAVISLRHLRKAAQRRFVTDFAEQLYHRKGAIEHRTALMVMIDECDTFVPQRVMGAEARCVGAIEDLVRRGRISGFGVVLISQRAASVNKDVLTQLELLVSHRHTSPQDRKALQEWIKAKASQERESEFMAAVASLPRGEAYFWSPEWLDVFEVVSVRERRTFDSSATPKAGQSIKAPKATAEVDLEALKTKLADTIRQREENDAARLKARIAELERERATQPDVQAIDPADIERAVAVRMMPFHGQLQRVATLFDSLLQTRDAVAPLVEQMGMLLAECVECSKSWALSPDDAAKAARVVPDFRPGDALAWNPDGTVCRLNNPRPRATIPAPRAKSNSNGAAGLGKCERAILTVLAQYPQGRSHTQTAILSGYSHTSGGYKNSLSRLRTAAYIEGGGDNMRITADGRAALGPVDPLPRGKALVAYWCGRLGKCERAILESLVRAYPKSHGHQSLAAATGYEPTSGGFKNSLSKLRTLELITRGSEIRASGTLFA